MRQRDRHSKNQERFFVFVFVVKSIRKTERRKKGEYHNKEKSTVGLAPTKHPLVSYIV